LKLEGLRVLDLSRFLPGPWITLTMADHGADVIKIESRDGEPTRHIGPDVAGHSVYFRNTQRGKRCLCLDLKAAEGKEVFFRLAERADVVLESFRPGVVDRLGIGYDAVRQRNPRAVYCSLSAFGQTGPLADHPSHDAGAHALTGVLSLSQMNGAPPTLPTLPTADISLGSAALCGILMALLRRAQTGKGDLVDVAMVDSLISWAPHMLGPVLAHDEAPDLASDRLHGGAAMYNIYRTSDGGYIVLSGAEIQFAENLLRALDRPDLIPLCKAPWGAAQEPVKQFFTATFLTRTRDEWDRWLSDKGVCYAPVLDLREAWKGDLLRDRGMIIAGPDGVEHLGTPIRFRDEPGAPSCAVPGLGEHTDEILESLGYDAAARAQLRAKGVC